jgi:hypothetical protein
MPSARVMFLGGYGIVDLEPGRISSGILLGAPLEFSRALGEGLSVICR